MLADSPFRPTCSCGTGRMIRTSISASWPSIRRFRYRERVPLRPHLICTRGFSTYYSVDVVVRAFALVKKEYPEAQLDLVGNGPLEGDVRKLAADLNLSGVNFTGVVSHREIGQYYDQADIFINASWLDNMPLSVIEPFAPPPPSVRTP